MVNYLSHSPDPRGEKNKRKMSAHVDLEDPALQGKDDSSLGGEGQPLVFVNFYMSSNTQPIVSLLPSLLEGAVRLTSGHGFPSGVLTIMALSSSEPSSVFRSMPRKLCPH